MTLPRRMAICLEDLAAIEDDERFLQCVALPGGLPGLTLDGAGEVRWRDPGALVEGGAHCELWVSADEQLIALRPQGADEVLLERAGRVLSMPLEKPVELLDEDVLCVGERRLRVHVHGFTEVEAEPQRFVLEPREAAERRDGPSRGVSTAAAIALGAAVGLGGMSLADAGTKKPPKPPVRVRPKPPAPLPRPKPKPKPKPKPPKKPAKPTKPDKKG